MAAPHTGKHPGHHTPGFTKHTSARGAPHPGLHEKNPSPTCGFHSEARTGTYPHPPRSSLPNTQWANGGVSQVRGKTRQKHTGTPGLLG